MEVCGRTRGDGCELTANTDCKGSIPLVKVLFSSIFNGQARSQVVCWGGAKHVISGLNHAMA